MDGSPTGAVLTREPPTCMWYPTAGEADPVRRRCAGREKGRATIIPGRCPAQGRHATRWLKAPMTMTDGTHAPRERGTPQGSPISPLLANLFMHYAFDKWMDREHPGCPFERYADDVVIHCDTEQQAQQLWANLAARLGSLGLELHPDKTKNLYCKDTKRRDEAQCPESTFLAQV